MMVMCWLVINEILISFNFLLWQMELIETARFANTFSNVFGWNVWNRRDQKLVHTSHVLVHAFYFSVTFPTMFNESYFQSNQTRLGLRSHTPFPFNTFGQSRKNKQFNSQSEQGSPLVRCLTKRARVSPINRKAQIVDNHVYKFI